MKQRELDTIYLPDSQLQSILDGMEEFLKSEDKYRNLGIPWRLGIMLHGPPGSGKSSLVQALSSHFQIPIYYLNANQVGASGIRTLLADVLAPCIILMEDIDSLDAAKGRKKVKDKDKDKMEVGIKPSELFNILDGLIATEQRIVIMTTNHPEDLDPALVRPGRVDYNYHLGYAEDSELRKFYGRAKEFYTLPEYSVFRKQLPENCTIAEAQSVVFKNQSDLTNNENRDSLTIGEN